MPLRPCPECHREVSTAATACPHCGHPLTVARRWPRRLQIIGGILAILAAPLLAIDPVLCLFAALPGLALFVVGRMFAG